MESATVAVVADPMDLRQIQDVAQEEGVEVRELDQQGFLDPASVTLLLLGSSLAVSTVAYFVEQRRGGQVFDLRDDAPRPAYRSRDIVYGLVEIIAQDGTVRVEIKEPKGMLGQVLDTLRAVLQDVGSNAAEPVAEAVRAGVGELATVARQP